jgi:hypothetical protein
MDGDKMELAVTNTKFEYDDATDDSTVTGVLVTSQVSELFGNTSGNLHEVKIHILPSEYYGNLGGDALKTLIIQKIYERFSTNKVDICLININYGSSEVAFNTIDIDIKNDVHLNDTISFSKEDLDALLAQGIDAVTDQINSKIVDEFNGSQTTTTTTIN